MEGRPIRAMRFTASRWNRGIFSPCRPGSQGMRFSRRMSTNREHTAHIPWAMRVAQATPATPMWNWITKTRSSTMLVRLEIIRKSRGVRLSPWAL